MQRPFGSPLPLLPLSRRAAAGPFFAFGEQCSTPEKAFSNYLPYIDIFSMVVYNEANGRAFPSHSFL